MADARDAAKAEPEASPVTGLPRAPLALDGRISEGDLQHDSRDDTYRTPGGAVPAGTPVLLRVRTAAGDAMTVEVRVTNRDTGASRSSPMSLVATDPTRGEHGYDWWQATVTTDAPAVLDYWFTIRDGSAMRTLSDDDALDGGTGRPDRTAPTDGGWQLTVYDPAFSTPDWARGAVVYQVFPDRFANGDPTNDPSPDAVATADGPGRFRYGDVYGNPILVKGWNELPEGYCRAYQDWACTEEPLGRDFYGGDLAGITQHLDELADLGVTVLYLNPIFAAPSNHRYDTSDYLVVDPDLGTDEDIDALIAAARERGIRVILDGVFNHVSSDSPWFDRHRRFSEIGACESADSPTRDWFTFRAPGPGEPSPCVSSVPGGTDTYYQGWFGFDTIPEVGEVPGYLELVTGPDGAVRHWLRRGIGGWRLDVTDSLSHELMAAIRDATKSEDPDALVIAEQWGDTSPWLLGDQADSTMNYRFRRAVIALVNGATADLDGSLAALTPTGFREAMEAVQEDYPAPAFQALMNLVDSHDTTRILWTLTPGPENEASKSEAWALGVGRYSLALLLAIQMTFPGMASIYYGGEVGLSGHDDPDDRRPYPWDLQDLDIRDTYRTLARARAEHVSLREGDLTFLVADDARNLLAFLRRTDTEAVVTAVNLGDRERVVPIDVTARLPDGAELLDLFDGSATMVRDGILEVMLAPRTARVLITASGTDLGPPPIPTGVAAVAAPGTVELTWEAPDDAVSHVVWRSQLEGGGFEPVASVTGTSFTDTGVRDGVPWWYAVTALDASGNASARSLEAREFPRHTIADLRLDAPAALTAVLSADQPGPTVGATVTVPVAPGGIAQGVRVEMGVGPVGSDPATDAGWDWVPATALAEDGATATFEAVLPATRPGPADVATRVTADGGATWAVADRTGSADGYRPTDAARLTVEPSTDTQPPAAPGAPLPTDVTGDHITMRWEPVDVDDLYGYRVLRGDGTDGPMEVIGETLVPLYVDTSVAAGAPYRYAVVALDTGLNASAPSAETAVTAANREVQVTFTVTVPPYTPPGDVVYIAGDFQGWAPGATPMTKVDAVTWSVTLPFGDLATAEYKYTRGSWEAVEKDAGCGEIANRRLTADHGGDGSQAVADSVEKWRDIDACG
jgi:glycosidase